MTLLEDFVGTIVVQAIGFVFACVGAWKHGRPLQSQGKLALFWLPYVCMGVFIVKAICAIGESDGYIARHWWQHQADLYDAALWLPLALLAFAFSRVAPWLIRSGIQLHPRPLPAPADIQARRRAERELAKRMRPFLCLGLGCALIVGNFAVQAHDGELLVYAFFGMVGWVVVLDQLGRRVLRRRAEGPNAGTED